jgi:hypothetical protein
LRREAIFPTANVRAECCQNAIGYAMHYSRSHDAVIRVYDAAGDVIETHDHEGDFKEW